MITVSRAKGDVFLVTVTSDVETNHRVTLTEGERNRIGGNDVSAERLIEESFRFLLEREPNTSILGAFELKVIQRYFPEYESTIRGRL